MKNKPYPHLLFVYGTLMQGHSNNRILIGESGKEATRLGSATTLSKYWMASGGFPRVAKQIIGGFPPSVERNDYHGQVKGEVWTISDAALKACDRLEGHPRFYQRELVPVTLDKDRTRLRPWMYIIVEPFRAYECIEKNASGVLRWQSLWNAV